MTKDIEISDDGLVARMASGDEDAFVLLYRRRHPTVFRFVLHMSGNRAVAEDVTQEVFLALIRDARRYDPNRGSVGGFLMGIARNHLKKRWEHDRRLVVVGDTTDDALEVASARNGAGKFDYGKPQIEQGAVEEVSEKATLETVRRAVSTLPEKYREVVALCDLEEMSYEKAAEALGRPVGTVRSRLHRARAMLLEKLKDGKAFRGLSEKQMSAKAGAKSDAPRAWATTMPKAKEGGI